MTYREIQTLVRNGENDRVEFKRKVAHPEKIVKEVIAFANSKGGHLLIGVDDDGSIPGLKFAEEEIFSLNNAIIKYCKPRINFKAEIIPISEKKSIIDYDIYPSRKKPHYLIENFATKQGTAYVRVEDKSIQASREVREILKREKNNKNIKFHYGEKEKLLMKYLEENKTITLTQFTKLAKISRYIASRTLVLLVLANVLAIQPNEKEDIFMIKNEE